jgi:D-alanyl-D-alanine carboxypeptidase
MRKTILLLCLAATLGAGAQNPPANIAASLQKMLNDVIASPANYSPGVVMRVHLPGRWTWAGANGRANITANRLAQPNDKYRIGSVSKNFTAVAILKLANEGKLSLNDKITTHLLPAITALIPNAAQISIRQCLNHNSGIADFANSSAIQNSLIYLPTRSISKFELYGAISQLPVRAQPGTDSSYYSNSNYLILKDIIEKITLQPYPTYIRNNIITPAGLTNTTCNYGSVLTAPFLSGYLPVNGVLVDYSNANYDWAMGLGEIISNTADQVKYFERLFNGQIIPRRWVDSMANFNLKPSTLGVNYGYGIWSINDLGGCIAKEHGGDVFGWSSLLTYFPQQNAYVAINFNTYELNQFRFVLRSLVCNLLNGRIYGENFRSIPAPAPAAPATPMLLPLPLNSNGTINIRGLHPSYTTATADALQVYPQPANASVQLQFTSESAGSATVRITNAAGQTLLTRTIATREGSNHLPFDIRTLPAGIYTLQLLNGNAHLQQKLVVQ